MRNVILATALLFSGAAIAQTGTQPETPTSMPQNATMPPAPAGASDPAGAAQASALPDSSPGATQVASADGGNYPVCSRTIRDKCINRSQVHR